jgi:hypothetical protein
MTSADSILRQLLTQPEVCLDSASVGRRVDPTAADEKQAASIARREEKIFGYWDGARFHYPAFQFEAGGGPRAETERLVQVLPRDLDGNVGTDATLWVFAPDDALDGSTPAEMFVSDPERVISLARTRRDGSAEVD